MNKSLGSLPVLLLGTLIVCSAVSDARAQVRVRVPGFAPASGGFHFSNSFASVPLLTIDVGGVNIPIGDASNGMCGGMIYTVLDFYEARVLPPPDLTPPSSGPLFDAIVRRLFDSFNLPNGPLKYRHLMDPNLPDHETWFSQLGWAPHGRAWVTIVEEWPRIKADLDIGRLSPMGLVRVKTLDVFQMGRNHQVLAYGYDLDGDDLTIHVYDPNHPNLANVRISLNIGDPYHTTAMTQSTGETLFCFFRPDYGYSVPPVTNSVQFSTRSVVSLQSWNGNYVVAEGGGGRELRADRWAIGPWEVFTLIDIDGGTLQNGDAVNLAASNGMFVVAEGGGGAEVNANRGVPLRWEAFTIYKLIQVGNTFYQVGGAIQPGDRVALKASNGQFVVAENGGGSEVNANRAAVGIWEAFTFR